MTGLAKPDAYRHTYQSGETATVLPSLHFTHLLVTSVLVSCEPLWLSPTPPPVPPVEEPTGLGSVVRDGDGCVWVRTPTNRDTQATPWTNATGSWFNWDDLQQPVTVLHRGMGQVAE